MKFIYVGNKPGLVNFYDGKQISKKTPAYISNPSLVAKARANPDFKEVETKRSK